MQAAMTIGPVSQSLQGRDIDGEGKVVLAV
jgi:hypothetical protein